MLTNKYYDNLFLNKKVGNKLSYRAPMKYVAFNSDGKAFLIESTKNEIEKFYMLRSIENQIFFDSNIISRFKLNCPLKIKQENELVVIYKYFEKYLWAEGDFASDEIKGIYDKYKKRYSLCEEILNKIQFDFLSCWPKEYWKTIVAMKSYQIYLNKLKEFDELDICFEHGDYSKNNILLTPDGYFWLIDFEFFKKFQPIGFDLYSWNVSVGIDDKEIPYYELNKLKYELWKEICNTVTVLSGNTNRLDLYWIKYKLILNFYKLYSRIRGIKTYNRINH